MITMLLYNSKCITSELLIVLLSNCQPKIEPANFAGSQYLATTLLCPSIKNSKCIFTP